MPAYSLVIFDFDGTLADSFPWFCSVLDQTADKFGLNRVKPEEIESLREHSSREALNRLGVPMWKLPAIANYMRGLAVEGISAIPLFPGAGATLAALHRGGVRLALVSSNAEAAVRAVLGPASDLIDRYACGSSLWGKASKFRSVLRGLGADHSQTLAIGDEIRDIDAAREAGLAAGAITFGYNSRQALAGHNPDYLFDDYDDLLSVVIG
ncbi:MAG: HAD hydrolase-like protein [Devosia sp.]